MGLKLYASLRWLIEAIQECNFGLDPDPYRGRGTKTQQRSTCFMNFGGIVEWAVQDRKDGLILPNVLGITMTDPAQRNGQTIKPQIGSVSQSQLD